MALHVTFPSLLAFEDLAQTGFWGEKASGWHYDLMLLSMNLVVVTTAGGRRVVPL